MFLQNQKNFLGKNSFLTVPSKKIQRYLQFSNVILYSHTTLWLVYFLQYLTNSIFAWFEINRINSIFALLDVFWIFTSMSRDLNIQKNFNWIFLFFFWFFLLFKVFKNSNKPTSIALVGNLLFHHSSQPVWVFVEMDIIRTLLLQRRKIPHFVKTAKMTFFTFKESESFFNKFGNLSIGSVVSVLLGPSTLAIFFSVSFHFLYIKTCC